MDWKSFLQGLVQNLLSTLLVLGGGTVLAILEARHSHWTGPVFYGFMGSAAVAVLIFALTRRPILSKKPPQTTVENVRTNIRAWLDYFGMGVQKKNDPQSHFLFIVTCRSGIGLIVARPKNYDRYLGIVSNLEVSKEHQDVLANLPREKSARIAEELTLELARMGTSYNLEFQPDGTMKKVHIEKSIPITGNLTEDTFIAYLNKVESNTSVAIEAIRLAVDSAKPLVQRS